MSNLYLTSDFYLLLRILVVLAAFLLSGVALGRWGLGAVSAGVPVLTRPDITHLSNGAEAVLSHRVG